MTLYTTELSVLAELIKQLVSITSMDFRVTNSTGNWDTEFYIVDISDTYIDEIDLTKVPTGVMQADTNNIENDYYTKELAIVLSKTGCNVNLMIDLDEAHLSAYVQGELLLVYVNDMSVTKLMNLGLDHTSASNVISWYYKP